MTTQQIYDALNALTEHFRELEDAYVENGGEVTEETLSMENHIADLQEMLLDGGVDSLGRWLKAKEDQKAALKAEKEKIDRMMKAADKTVDYIKQLIDTILFSCGQEQAKGLLYSFKRTTSTTHTANTDLIEDRYHEAVEKAAKIAGLPVWLKLTVKPSWSPSPKARRPTSSPPRSSRPSPSANPLNPRNNVTQ